MYLRCSPLHSEPRSSLLCPFRALKYTLSVLPRTESQNSFFLASVTEQKVVSGCFHISILLLGVSVPHRIQSPFHQRHHLFLGMVQRGVHFRHLWGGQLVLAVHICKVLQPGCPCLAGQSPFCLSSNLPVSLDQHCSSPSFAWSVHN